MDLKGRVLRISLQKLFRAKYSLRPCKNPGHHSWLTLKGWRTSCILRHLQKYQTVFKDGLIEGHNLIVPHLFSSLEWVTDYLGSYSGITDTDRRATVQLGNGCSGCT